MEQARDNVRVAKMVPPRMPMVVGHNDHLVQQEPHRIHTIPPRPASLVSLNKRRLSSTQIAHLQKLAIGKVKVDFDSRNGLMCKNFGKITQASILHHMEAWVGQIQIPKERRPPLKGPTMIVSIRRR